MTASVPPGRPPTAAGSGLDAGIRHNTAATLRLALPVMVARSGTLAMITADVVMTGWHRAEELGYYALGFMAHQVLLVLGQGALTATTVLAAQADGAGEHHRGGTVWKVALAFAVVLGVAFALLSLLGAGFFRLTGQSEVLAVEGGAVMAAFGVGLPALLMYVATALFLEGISRPRANMWLMVAANLLNIVLNWLFIYPHGFTTWSGEGSVGAAFATSLTRWGMCAALVGYVLVMRGRERHDIRGPLRYPLEIARKLLRLGLPLMAAQGLEAGAFLTVTLFAGWLGAAALAVYQIVNNLFHITFMLALGLAAAASVRVGNAVGRRSRGGVAWAGWSAVGLGAGLFGVLGIGFWLLARPLATLYTADPVVLGAAAGVIAIAGPFVLVDGLQAVLVGALRGTGDIVVPSTLAVGSFWGVAVILGHLWAVTQGHGVAGLIWGLTAGAGTASVLLLARFARVSRRDVRPV